MITATIADVPDCNAIIVPPLAKTPRPIASGHCIARSVNSRCLALKKIMAKPQMIRIAQIHQSFAIQNSGLRFNRMSRRVPPPNAATAVTIAMPTMSSFLRAASISPEKAKASVPKISKGRLKLVAHH